MNYDHFASLHILLVRKFKGFIVIVFAALNLFIKVGACLAFQKRGSYVCSLPN